MAAAQPQSPSTITLRSQVLASAPRKASERALLVEHSDNYFGRDCQRMLCVADEILAVLAVGEHLADLFAVGLTGTAVRVAGRICPPC